MPERIQRQRTKGWRLPEGAVYVGRPSRWGNSYVLGRIGDMRRWTGWIVVHDDVRIGEPFPSKVEAARSAVDLYAFAVARGRGDFPWPAEIRAELAGKDLVCWCPPDQPCHADVLLEIANGGGL